MSSIIAADIYRLFSVTDPQLSPDGKRAAFVKTIADEAANTYVSHIHIMNLADRQSIQWTFGSSRNQTPRWSPDGRKIAFVSDRSGKNQLYVMATAGGEPECLTDFPEGAGSIVWSPCSKKILSSARVKFLYAQREAIFKKYEDLKIKSDASGYEDGKKQQLFLVNLDTNECTQITNGEYDSSPSSWSPDGEWITFHASGKHTKEFHPGSDIYSIHTENFEITRLTPEGGFFTEAAWSPDSRYLAMTGHAGEYKSATLPKIWLFDSHHKEVTCLTPYWDEFAGDTAIGDFHIGSSETGIKWTDDSCGFYFISSGRGSTSIYYGNIEGAIYPSRVEAEHIYGFSINGSTHEAVIAVSRPDSPGELYHLNLTNGNLEQLTFVNHAFLKDKKMNTPEPFSWTSGGQELHGWLLKPLDCEEGRKYPLILEIHGGPHAMYANTYYHEFQTLASQGYAVLYTNPRGSQGYGQDFADAVRGDYGGRDYEDLMSAVDHVLGVYDFIDHERIGVTGGSYGGFMTNWIIGRNDRFKAAVSQRCISNWISFYGVSDIGYYFTEWELKGNVMDDPELLWEHSPLKYVSKVETPLLLLHGENDYRCPVQQAEEFYAALKRQQKEVCLITYPGENHEITRSGKPHARIHHIEQILNWFLTHV
ncbi:S9 family peptidase [Peribacillus sp. SCS-37]|uniref:S9 family peptidase n=1 Tax=Paraperibacillus esterisolvens TaxID=3115296 RepID=UPI0039063827